jgi:regulator of nonsense transcripts 2
VPPLAGELLKFRVFPPGSAFSALKSLLDDFSGHNIDAACALTESAGRFLARWPETAARMANMLDVMVRLKNVRNLDARQGGLVDAAYFVIKAPSRTVVMRKERPPVHEFVRHLVYQQLVASPRTSSSAAGGRGGRAGKVGSGSDVSGDSVAYVARKLRRLSWDEYGDYVACTMLRASRKGRFSQLGPLAALAATLSRFHSWLGVALADAALEDIVAGLEFPEAGMYQRRLAAVAFLGELYCHRLVSVHVVFSTLYVILAHGHGAGISPAESARLDPPGNFFRIRMAAALLERCGTLLARGAARRRLDRYLQYLQRYILSKPPLPLDVELDVVDLWSRLGVEPPGYSSYEAACIAIADAEAKEAASRAAGLPAIDEDEEEEEEEEDDEEDDGEKEVDERVESEEEEESSEEEEGSTSEDEDDDDDDSSDDEG